MLRPTSIRCLLVGTAPIDVQEVLDELSHATRKIEPGTARDILRSYGVTFETFEGETPEPGDVPAESVTTPLP